jgi:hypothetical protein
MIKLSCSCSTHISIDENVVDWFEEMKFDTIAKHSLTQSLRAYIQLHNRVLNKKGVFINFIRTTIFVYDII